jgi:hypothetical protein
MYIHAYRSHLLFDKNFVHINFVIALMLALISFLAGIDQTDSKVLKLIAHSQVVYSQSIWDCFWKQEVCQAMTFVMHYLFLAVFSWMLCEGIVLYLLLVVVFHSGKSHSRSFFCLGWGKPKFCL